MVEGGVMAVKQKLNLCLNPQRGDMFRWVDYTWNPVSGRCPFACRYCYMRAFWPRMGDPHLRRQCLEGRMPPGATIFVGSSIDMWAPNIPDTWIMAMLAYCRRFPETVFYFESKNPARFAEFMDQFPESRVLGTTIETNRPYAGTAAPDPDGRALPFVDVVSVEPVMEFDLDEMVSLMRRVGPRWIALGADSKGHGLPEPTAEELRGLVDELEKFTEVRPKKNLGRLQAASNGGRGA
jgi:hypothetical protein